MLKEYLGEVPVGISNRHVHICQRDLEVLFGRSELTVMKPLFQPDQFAAEEKVTLVGPKRSIEGVRILGQMRDYTQVEISRTDSYTLGVEPALRDSGDLEGTPGITIRGPKGEITLEKGVIIARRHIHMTEAEAEQFGVKDKDVVNVLVEGERPVVLSDVLIRVNNDYALEMHIDTDEANSSFVVN
ncbi:MAG TPA: propanediol utilization protein, partial [Firmicutes bacterium]|nr:propanediol utilization protein [Bacillota bacterium]